MDTVEGTKGDSFDTLNQDDINLMMNHINSVKRYSLDGGNPYTLIKEFLPDKIIRYFNIKVKQYYIKRQII